VSEVSAGTHTVYIGQIVDIALDAAAMPLVYADGNFVHGEILRKAAQAA